MGGKGAGRNRLGIRLKAPIIKELLAKSKLNYKGLAKKAGISPSMVGKLMEEEKFPSLVTLGQIAEALGVEPHQIATGLEPISSIASGDGREESLLQFLNNHPKLNELLGDMMEREFLREGKKK